MAQPLVSECIHTDKRGRLSYRRIHISRILDRQFIIDVKWQIISPSAVSPFLLVRDGGFVSTERVVDANLEKGGIIRMDIGY